jgi:hypothetical protein
MVRLGLTAVSILAMASSALSATPGEAWKTETQRSIANALAFFQRAETASIPEFLGRIRPAPLSLAVRAQVIAGLPTEGELLATQAERAKIATLEPIFDFHGRKNALEIKVIDVGHAFVGLHARTVLLLSREALTLLTPDELQALAAHELGHEYVWDEYWTAMTTQAHARMQELELVCDGIAVMSLRALGLEPARLVAAVTKVTRYNERLGATASAGSYVSLKERRRFIEAIAALFEAGLAGQTVPLEIVLPAAPKAH